MAIFMGFSTTAIHAGNEPDASTGAVSVPIYQTSTYAQEGLGKHKGYEYARTQNPTRAALERNIAALENAKFGYAFASGMAAIDAVLKLVKGGDHVILGDNTYGGTFRLFSRVLSEYGVQFDLADTTDIPGLESAFRPNTKMVFVETPTNPVMSVTDLRAVSDLAHSRGARVVCDNTFMSPYFQRPIEHGVDIVVHSTTKYLNGHSDSVGGFVALNDEKDAEWIGFVQNSIGAILSPFDAFLVLRGTTGTAGWSRISSPSILRCRRFTIPASRRIRSMSWLNGSRPVLAVWWPLRPVRWRRQKRSSKASNCVYLAKALAALKA
jgi:cystathionine beta-lyase/cystathionine gamma-synthase